MSHSDEYHAIEDDEVLRMRNALKLSLKKQVNEKKKVKVSIFDYELEKVKWKLSKDSSSMGYAIYLKPQYNGGLEISTE